MNKALRDKIIESLTSVLPIALIVMVLSVAFVPLDAGTFLLFLVGVFLLIVGLGAFMLGADLSMLVIGEKIGATMTHSRKLWLIALLSFVIGIIVTIAEPDLQILAEQVPAIAARTPLKNYLLILTVAVGVGIFLTIGMLRIVFRIPLHYLLLVFYAAAFLLSIFVDPSFWAVSFDAGGVTTGPMTVPFIMSLGVGVASIRGGKGSKNDCFGLVALSSVGPIVAVLTLGIIFRIKDVEYVLEPIAEVENTRGVFFAYLHGFGDYAVEVSIARSPIIAFFILFQVIFRAFRKRQVVRIAVGFVYTFVGLAVFLAGANVGFMPVGRAVGQGLASLEGGWKWLLVPVGMIIGYFVVAAEPAVHVLNKQVERMSAGAISASAMMKGLCIGVCISLGLAMLRILTGINIMWILVPGYLIALVLTFFTPPLFTGIAFDSGGVASGAMVSSFVLPLAIGACSVLDPAGIMTQAFGCVAFVALTPLISIQVLGIAYKHKTRSIKRKFLAVEDKILEYEVN